MVEEEFLRLDLNWKSRRVKEWMARLAEKLDRPVDCVADIPFEAMCALYNKLRELPVQPSLLDSPTVDAETISAGDHR